MFFGTSSLKLCPTPRLPRDILPKYALIRAGNMLDESVKFDSLPEMSKFCPASKGSMWNDEHNSACDFFSPLKNRFYADEKEA